MFDELLSFHQPAWIKGAEYYAQHVFYLWNMGLYNGPVYPEEWFAGRWERKAIDIIVDLLKQNAEVTTASFSAALRQATDQAQGIYP